MGLTFKGDAKPKKRKRQPKSEERDESNENDSSIGDTDWVICTQLSHMMGPTFISFGEPVKCIGYDLIKLEVAVQNVHANAVSLAQAEAPDNIATPPSKSSELSNYRPTETHHVWIVSKIGTSSTVTFRTAEGKFLASDQHGSISADREARGPQEEWTPVPQSDGSMAFQNLYGKFLSFDEIAGGKQILRGDSESIGYNERFSVSVQKKYKMQGLQLEKEREGHLSVQGIQIQDERALAAKYQTWGTNAAKFSEEDKKALKKAQKDGRLAEEMLDRRSKLKSDKFAW